MKIIFSTQKYQYFKDLILSRNSHLIDGVIEAKSFPDGEIYQRIKTDVNEKNVIIVGGTITDEDTMELLDIAAGCAQYGALSIDVIIPFFGYSTMERAVKNGEIVKAKNRCTLLSAIPRTSLGTKIYMFDLHSEGIPYYFENTVFPFHIKCNELWVEVIRKMHLHNFVIASTDAGRAKWVENLAQHLHVDAAFVYKRRISGDEVALSAINADVQGKDVIVYDDMIRTGGSLIQAIKAYKENGAKDIYVIATHGLMVNNATQKILDCEGVVKIYISNSHSNANFFTDTPGVEVVDVTKLFNFIF